MKYTGAFESELVEIPAYQERSFYAVIARLVREAEQKARSKNELLGASDDCGAGRDVVGDGGALAALESAATETETGQDCELSDGGSGVSDSADNSLSDNEDD